MLDGVPARSEDVAALGIGTASEHWFQPKQVGSLFFWRGEPCFLGSFAFRAGHGSDTVIFFRDHGVYREQIEECHGLPLELVRSDAAGYVAVTTRALIVGEF